MIQKFYKTLHKIDKRIAATSVIQVAKKKIKEKNKKKLKEKSTWEVDDLKVLQNFAQDW